MTHKPPTFHVSDHMLLRYLSRMLGVDVESFRLRLHDKLEPYAKAGVRSVEDAGMVFKFSYSDGLVSVSTCWPSGHIAGKKQPPSSAQDSREAMKFAARKRMRR